MMRCSVGIILFVVMSLFEQKVGVAVDRENSVLSNTLESLRGDSLRIRGRYDLQNMDVPCICI